MNWFNTFEFNTGGGGGGTSNYNQLSNKPSVNNVTLQGNKSLNDLGLYSKSEVDTLVSGGGGNVIETEIEFVEETYEEDGEEYTELVLKFTNEEALLNAIYGENRDELNSPTIAIKYRPLYNPIENNPLLPPGGTVKILSDEFTEYYHCKNTLQIYEEDDTLEPDYALFLFGQTGAFTDLLIDPDTQAFLTSVECYNVRSMLTVYSVIDENLKPCGLIISDSYAFARFNKVSMLSEDVIVGFIYPLIGIYDYTNLYFNYVTPEYEYGVNIDYIMGINDITYAYMDKPLDFIGYGIVNSVCRIKYGPGCTVHYYVTLELDQGATFIANEKIVGSFIEPFGNILDIPITAIGRNQQTDVGTVNLFLTTDGNIYTGQSISGIDEIAFAMTYQIRPDDMLDLW